MFPGLRKKWLQITANKAFLNLHLTFHAGFQFLSHEAPHVMNGTLELRSVHANTELQTPFSSVWKLLWHNKCLLSQ